MVISASYELKTFAAAILIALFGGVIYDIGSAFGKVTGKKMLFDLLSWIAACIFCGGIWFFAQNGEIRWYMVAAAILSAVLYYFLLEKYVFLIFLFLAKILCGFFDIILKILLTPPKFLCKILGVYVKRAKTKFLRKVEDDNYEKTPQLE